MTAECRSAYGLNFDGLGAPPHMMNGPVADAPTVSARWHVGNIGTIAPDVDIRPGPDQAVVHHPAGVRIELDRALRSVDFHGRDVAPDQRAHPLLSAVAAIHNRWVGREVFHAGVVLLNDRAWMLLGPREAGKSTLLAGLAARGHHVLADDIAVTDGSRVFSGPRCIDLREAPPIALGPLVSSRGGARQRLLLQPAPDCVPIGGWVRLRWAGRISIDRMAGLDALTMLAKRRMMRELASSDAVMLDLAQRPALVFERPRSWDLATHALDRLVDKIESYRAADHRR